MTYHFLPRLMQAKAAAHYLGVSLSKLRQLDLPCKRDGGNVLYDRRDLDAWADGLPYDGQAPLQVVPAPAKPKQWRTG
ncbi:hypothetical protein SAMN05216376_105223 [Mameliella alba]|uniref:helix-turn-helix domain-containing protein n=1 Tax=Mameliella alba TaxID=561184 RepID=UPI00088CBE1E|nr:helix-turn-helix domain-containing protein [Mameliella alba]PTR40314.1 hypothetical protein LX94_01796 [Mameliella alba]GGF44025.1 hypothetical protein GCM10011319_02250 [Mameliella alba]SDC99121.1 hypothetical protein SAMN05216376_105223 [Mameliella alba]